MGIKQEHGRVLKLQVVQTLYSMVPYTERGACEASFEAACRKILGSGWDESGLSMESAEGLSHYLRGMQSAAGKPVRINNSKLMTRLARSLESFESRAALIDADSLAGAIAMSNLEMESATVLKQYGLDEFSTEGLGKVAVEYFSRTLKGFFKGHPAANGGKTAEKAFDPKNVNYREVGQMVSHLDDMIKTVQAAGTKAVEGQVSGAGIVKNLTWGHDFDEKDPAGFVKKKFAEWDKFYQAWDASVGSTSARVLSVDKATRTAVKAARDDEDKMRDILDGAHATLSKADNPSKVAERMKPTFPGGRVARVHKDTHGGYDEVSVGVDAAAKDREKIRALTAAEAQALLTWLKGAIEGLKKYTTVYDKARWADHSDGDTFWDITEHLIESDMHASLVYWQTCDDRFIDNVDDISEILARLSNGIVNWVDRSFKG